MDKMQPPGRHVDAFEPRADREHLKQLRTPFFTEDDGDGAAD